MTVWWPQLLETELCPLAVTTAGVRKVTALAWGCGMLWLLELPQQWITVKLVLCPDSGPHGDLVPLL